MIIVARHITIEPEQRESYLAGCASERWESQAAVEAFRGDGPGEDQGTAMLAASVGEYDVADKGAA